MSVTLLLQRPVDLQEGVLVTGFPSVGLVSTIAANYLIHQLKLEQVGSLVSRLFPLVSVVRDGVPVDPIRIYAGKHVVVVVSEFRPPAHAIAPMADAILQSDIAKQCRLIITSEGIPPADEQAPADSCRIFGVGSTPGARDTLTAHKLPFLASGMVSGLSAQLLNEGGRAGRDVLCLIAEAHPDFPDARAGARLVEVIDGLLPEIALDTTPLYDEAERIDKELKITRKARTTVERTGSLDPLPPGMYG